jgi:hypothetical protein
MAQSCGRCKCIKYSGDPKFNFKNHKLSCDDGASPSSIQSAKTSLSKVIPYPQHPGVFSSKTIKYQAFLKHLKSALELSYRVAVCGEPAEVAIEDVNLSLFLEHHIQDIGGCPMLIMDGLEVNDKSALVVEGGVSYLRLDVLKESA